MEERHSKALESALTQIERQFGKGSIMRLGDHSQAQDIQTVSTGSLGLDIALGLEVYPKDVLLKFMVQNLQVKRH